MAPKRAAKKAAAPPPPPPPAESSDETRSGSRSRSEESEDEDAIGESPVPAATPAPKSTPAPAQNGDQSESSGEEEEEDEEEEEGEDDQPAPAAPKNQAPPPQNKEDSDTSGDEDDNEEEEEEEEPTRAAPPSVPKKQPPQPRKKGDSDTSGDDEEEEAPPPKPAPKKDAAAPKPPAPAEAADEAKKPVGFHRIWSTDDELRILEVLAAHQKQHGAFPQPDALVDVLAGKLDNPAYGSKELQSKVKSLRQRYLTLSKRDEVPSKEHDRRVLDLSKIVWDGDKTTAAAASDGPRQKGFDEMCELYPYLAEEVKKLEAARPGMCKREFGKMEDDKARAMDEKIKKQRVVQMRMEMRSADLTKEVTKAFMDLIDG